MPTVNERFHQIYDPAKIEQAYDLLANKGEGLVLKVMRRQERRDKRLEKKYPHRITRIPDLVQFLVDDQVGEEEVEDCALTFIALGIARDVRNFLDETGAIPRFKEKTWGRRFAFLNSRYSANTYATFIERNNAFTEIPYGAARIDEIAQARLPLHGDIKWKIDQHFTGADSVDELHEAVLFSYLLRHTPEELNELIARKMPKGQEKYANEVQEKMGALRERAIAYVENYQNQAIQGQTRQLERDKQVQQALALVGSRLFPTSIEGVFAQLSGEVREHLSQSIARRYEGDHKEDLAEKDAANMPVYKDALLTYKDHGQGVVFDELEATLRRKGELPAVSDIQSNLFDQSTFEGCRNLAKGHIDHIGDIGSVSVEISARTPGVVDVFLVVPNSNYDTDGYDHTVLLQITPSGQVLGIANDRQEAAPIWLTRVQELISSAVDVNPKPQTQRRDKPLASSQSAVPAVRVQPEAVFVRPVVPAPANAKKRKANGNGAVPKQKDIVVPTPIPEAIPQRKTVYPTPRYLRTVKEFANNPVMVKEIEDTIEAIKNGTAILRRTGKNMKDAGIVVFCVNLSDQHRLLLVEGENATDLFALSVGNHRDYETDLKNFRRLLRHIDFSNPPEAL